MLFCLGNVTCLLDVAMPIITSTHSLRVIHLVAKQHQTNCYEKHTNVCINWSLLLCNMQQNYHKLIILMYSKIQWMWINCNHWLCNSHLWPCEKLGTYHMIVQVSVFTTHQHIGITIFNYGQRKFSPDDFSTSESYLRPIDDSPLFNVGETA